MGGGQVCQSGELDSDRYKAVKKPFWQILSAVEGPCEIMNGSSRVLDCGGESSDRDNSPPWDDQISRVSIPDPIDESTHEDAYGIVLGNTIGDDSWPSASEVEEQPVTGSGDQLTSAQRPRFAIITDGNGDSRSGDPQYTANIAPEKPHLYLDSGAPSR